MRRSITKVDHELVLTIDILIVHQLDRNDLTFPVTCHRQPDDFMIRQVERIGETLSSGCTIHAQERRHPVEYRSP